MRLHLLARPIGSIASRRLRALLWAVPAALWLGGQPAAALPVILGLHPASHLAVTVDLGFAVSTAPAPLVGGLADFELDAPPFTSPTLDFSSGAGADAAPFQLEIVAGSSILTIDITNFSVLLQDGVLATGNPGGNPLLFGANPTALVDATLGLTGTEGFSLLDGLADVWEDHPFGPFASQLILDYAIHPIVPGLDQYDLTLSVPVDVTQTLDLTEDLSADVSLAGLLVYEGSVVVESTVPESGTALLLGAGLLGLALQGRRPARTG